MSRPHADAEVVAGLLQPVDELLAGQDGGGGDGVVALGLRALLEGDAAAFLEERALDEAARHLVTLALEIMDTPFMNSISRYLVLKECLPSPWLLVYPDLGNLTAWGNDVERELRLGINHIVGIHVKETRPVGPNFPGAFRDVPFGEGTVDFVHCFKVLHELRYAGPFMVEMWTEKATDPLKEIALARQWVGERLQQGGYV